MPGVDPPGQVRLSPPDTLQGGPARPPLLDGLLRSRRQGAVTAAWLLVGVLIGGGATWWWGERPPEEPRSSSAAVGTSVGLVLSGVAPRTRPNGRVAPVGAGPLWIDGVLLRSPGSGAVTVTRIHRPGESITIRVPELPVTLSDGQTFEQVRLSITPRDCVLATQWTPSAQPFTLTWQDADGDVHEDLAGEHDGALQLSLIRHMNAACDDTPTP